MADGGSYVPMASSDSHIWHRHTHIHNPARDIGYLDLGVNDVCVMRRALTGLLQSSHTEDLGPLLHICETKCEWCGPGARGGGMCEREIQHCSPCCQRVKFHLDFMKSASYIATCIAEYATRTQSLRT